MTPDADQTVAGIRPRDGWPKWGTCSDCGAAVIMAKADPHRQGRPRVLEPEVVELSLASPVEEELQALCTQGVRTLEPGERRWSNEQLHRAHHCEAGRQRMRDQFTRVEQRPTTA